jgi:ATP-dependent RNA helicase DDX23/PRP28
MYELKELLTNSGNSVPGELANNQAAKVKPLRDAKGQKLSRNDFMGMQDIIH